MDIYCPLNKYNTARQPVMRIINAECFYFTI